jgi:predicted acyl esterase
LDPRSPLAHGWLRASHRRLDQSRSTPWRPYHTHTEHQPLRPGEVYELEVELWPTSIVVPTGYCIGLTVRGNDYRYEGLAPGDSISTFKNPLTGVGPFLHDDPEDRPSEVFGGITTIHGGPVQESSVLLPLITGNR